MNVGYQTISWGRTLGDGGKAMLNAIRAAGYKGVEIAQHPDEFGSAKALYSLLKDARLKLLGLAGGSVEERSRFAQQLIDAENEDLVHQKEPTKKRVIQFHTDYPYIYVDTWDRVHPLARAGRRGRVALHPHMFKPIQTASEALEVLGVNPELRFLPDTAHLTVAGDDILKVLRDSFMLPIIIHGDSELKRQKFGPVIAIHLKDWTSEFGRSYQFYSRGFGVEFGRGEVKLEEIVRFLKNEGYNRWVVVEQDVVDNPMGATHACYRWLKEMGV